ncbi:MAG TPA: AMMECR1 domain-containing protein [Oculatellaceae cyanobacterium]
MRSFVPSPVCLFLLAAFSVSPLSAAVPTGVDIETDYLPAIAKETLAVYFGHSEKKYGSLREFADSLPVPPKYRKCAGMFVTLSHNGKTRACWGSVNPQYPDLVKGTVYATVAALEKEYRFHKVRASEWNTLKPQVTLIKSIEPITSLEGQNPLVYGLLVRAGGRNAILLPGETSDATYQLIQCKVKAGLPTNKPCQMYRVVANVLN